MQDGAYSYGGEAGMHGQRASQSTDRERLLIVAVVLCIPFHVNRGQVGGRSHKGWSIHSPSVVIRHGFWKSYIWQNMLEGSLFPCCAGLPISEAC